MKMEAELDRLNNAFNAIVEIAWNSKLPKVKEYENANEKLILAIDCFLNLGFTVTEDKTYKKKMSSFLERSEIKEQVEKLNAHNENKNLAVLRQDYDTAVNERNKATGVWKEIRMQMQLSFYNSKNFFVMQENAIQYIPLDIPSGSLNYDAMIRDILKFNTRH